VNFHPTFVINGVTEVHIKTERFVMDSNQNHLLTLLAVWPTARILKQRPMETQSHFRNRIWSYAKRRSPLSGRLVGVMSAENLESYKQSRRTRLANKKRFGVSCYGSLPAVNRTKTIDHGEKLFRVDLEITGFIPFERCLKFFEA